MADRSAEAPDAAKAPEAPDVPEVPGNYISRYYTYIEHKKLLLLAGFAAMAALILLSISLGAVPIPIAKVLEVLFSPSESSRFHAIVLNIRLPQALTAMVAGGGLAVSGAVMQIILQNPLGSPFTLGISNAAAFGAAFSVMILGTGIMQSSGTNPVSIASPYQTTLAAFAMTLIASGIILLLSRLKKSSPEVMVLAGVTLGSLFTAGTMFLQYFADDVQLAAMVFWTFGDTARASWGELFIITVVTLLSFLFFLYKRWDYNALNMGHETAHGLGVSVGRVRLSGMLVSSLVTAVIISFIGVIGFVGLVAPHITRRLIGEDQRFFIPGSMLTGSLLLLASDLIARLLLAPQVLPAAIITSFLGAPIFISLLLRGYRR